MRFRRFVTALFLILIFFLISTALVEAKPKESFSIKGSVMFIGPSGLLKIKVDSHSKNIKGFVKNNTVSIRITPTTKFYFASFVKTNKGLELKKHKGVSFSLLKIKSKVFVNGFILENNEKELIAMEVYIILK
ncbi:MAG: hypothetical protein ACPLSN_09110 [Dictyoglomus turgidum]|jgi:agmatine/peptidylarginine deiminase